jgi:hypothetical protein
MHMYSMPDVSHLLFTRLRNSQGDANPFRRAKVYICWRDYKIVEVIICIINFAHILVECTGSCCPPQRVDPSLLNVNGEFPETRVKYVPCDPMAFSDADEGDYEGDDEGDESETNSDAMSDSESDTPPLPPPPPPPTPPPPPSPPSSPQPSSLPPPY